MVSFGVIVSVRVRVSMSIDTVSFGKNPNHITGGGGGGHDYF